ncbi:MAG: response regulator [Bdellovibrionales bacterium]|nr:response regulator [Ramlibacter sp.]
MTDHQAEILDANILVVDDQPANVQLLEQMLGSASYRRVTSTTRPESVCALHADHHYDLILLDLKMPVMDGFEVMDQLKAAGADAALPVIVLTAEPGHKLRALMAGARDFISKPFDLVEVRTRIHNMLELQVLYKKLEAHNQSLEQIVLDRTKALHDSEARFQQLAALASDWYWEQGADADGTTVSGPVAEILGLRVTAFFGHHSQLAASGWNLDEQKALHALLATQQPFNNFKFSRINHDGTCQYFSVSGEPMLDPRMRFVGYRGIGMEIKT